jgi:hypothetical protein
VTDHVRGFPHGMAAMDPPQRASRETFPTNRPRCGKT